MDASIELGGAGLSAAIVGEHLDAAGEEFDRLAVVVQGSVAVAQGWEVFARWEWGDDDGPADQLQVITAGLVRSFAGRDLKWTTDLGYGINGVGDFWSSGGAGWRADEPGEDGQIVVRSQFQLLF